MTQSLAGLVVVVTRPARQAPRFIGLLREHGATAVAFPTIAIEPVPLAADAVAELSIRPFDWIVYTSANAVEQALLQLRRPAGAKVAAIGRATARALEAAGIEVDALPSSGADSEALLAAPEFGDPRGKRILIVKGIGGRDALRVGLEGRGATVETAEIYRRVPVVPSQGAVGELRRACEATSAVIAVTSVELLESLLELAGSAQVQSVRDHCLLVPGERVASAARRLGWRGEVVVARTAEDDAMLEALVSRGTGSRSAPA